MAKFHLIGIRSPRNFRTNIRPHAARVASIRLIIKPSTLLYMQSIRCPCTFLVVIINIVYFRLNMHKAHFSLYYYRIKKIFITNRNIYHELCACTKCYKYLSSLRLLFCKLRSGYLMSTKIDSLGNLINIAVRQSFIH